MNSATEGHLSTADVASAGNGVENDDKSTASQPGSGSPALLLPSDVVEGLRNRWSDIQTGFVDEPQAAVRQADELVAVAMKRLAEGFAEQRSALEHQWDRGNDVSTEDLRLALRKYRAFFQRLLAIQAPVLEP
jgi:hypothetical protein